MIDPAASMMPAVDTLAHLTSTIYFTISGTPKATATLSGILKLRLARREENGLIYVGRVGTGWDRKTARAIRHALEPLARRTAPLVKPLKKADTTWVEPRFDAEIAYSEITDDGIVRHPSFKRLVP
jgi:ATP-dependent DNA ligase